VSSLDDLTVRIQALLHDPDAVVWETHQIRDQLLSEIVALSRHHLFGNLVWLHAVEGKAIYDLTQQGIAVSTVELLAETEPSLTTLSHPGATFLSDGVAVDDRVWLLRDGSRGQVSEVSETQVVMHAGLQGGRGNLVLPGEVVVIERPLQHDTVTAVQTVIYDGRELLWVDEAQIDRLMPGLMLRVSEPVYWSTDNQTRPTVIRLYPPPRVGGDSHTICQSCPLLFDWRRNLLIFLTEQPQGARAPKSRLRVPEYLEAPLAYRTASELLMREGDSQNLPVSVAFGAVAGAFYSALGVSTGG
jgi:hypothetical protein